MLTRKGLMIPTWVMIFSFIIGVVIVVIWGMQALVFNANLAAASFTAMATLFSMGVFSLILVAALILLTIKLWYVMVPFWLGMLVGYLFVTYLSFMGALS